MIRVTTSSVIEAAAETVWTAIRGFNTLPEWLPGITASQIEDGSDPDRLGCIRELTLANGGRLREQMVGFSDADRSVTYTILICPLPLQNYVSTLRLLPVTDGARSFIEWTAEFDVSAEHEADMRRVIGQDIHQAGFDSLKRRFGSGAAT